MTDGGSESPAQVLRNRIIKRAAVEFRDGMYGILLSGVSFTLKISACIVFVVPALYLLTF